MAQRLRDIGNRDVSMIVTVQSGGGPETERHWKQRCINDRQAFSQKWQFFSKMQLSQKKLQLHPKPYSYTFFRGL